MNSKSLLIEKDILDLFSSCNAVWIHDGYTNKPHAELHSGLCSNGYFNCPEVLKYPQFCEKLAQELVWKLSVNGIRNVDWVIGSSYAAITLSYEVAKKLNAIHAFTEKDPSGIKKMVWRRMTIPAEATVLQVEELITTSETFKEVRRAIEEGNSEPVNFLPIIGTIVHRPHKRTDYTDYKIITLIEKEIWTAEPDKCPLCKAGSPRYRPKSHWKELLG